MAEFKTENLRIILDGPGGTDTFFVRSFTGAEGLSRLFRLDLDLLSIDKELDLDSMLGAPLTLQVMTAGGARTFYNGIVSSIRQTGSTTSYAVYEAEMVPSLWLLTLGTNSRIFQFKTVPEIVHEVIEGAGAKVTIDDRLEGSYEPREYCVQYQESDFAFVSRLMEQEGIFFYFAHEDGAHTLVLGDAKGHHDDCPVEASFEMLQSASRRSDRDYVTSFDMERRLAVGVFSTVDYNFKTPGSDLLVTKSGEDKPEHYEYPGEFEKRSVGEGLAERRLEEQEWQRHTASGAGECRALRSGHLFELTKHSRGDFNGTYLLTEVSHEASQSGELGSESVGGSEEFNYRVDFSVVAADIPYRAPRVTPRPGIFGAQPAVVTGKSGEEIWTDEYGRVKVQFFWDRLGKRDENSSCWIRCVYGVAGKSWGQIFIPRMGQEVLVAFIEGDPDRPYIIGGVYNDEQMPPYGLPGDQTKSTVKSRSSKGGSPDNFNEIRLEDKKGQEEVYIHAEKDHNQVTENDRSESVGHDRSLDVGNDKSESIGNNKSIAVGVDHTESIGANKDLTVGANHTEKVGANMTVQVGSNLTETVAINYAETVGVAMELTVGAAMAETIGAAKAQTIGAAKLITIGANKTEDVGASKSVSVGENLTEKIGGAHSETVAKEYTLKAKSILIDAEDEITIQSGKSVIQLKKDGTIVIEGKKISVKGKSEIVMKAKKILQN